MLFKLAWKSLASRRYTAMLTILSIAISIFVLIGVDHIRHEAKRSFSQTVSGVDLIVGARTGSINLMLYAVFHIGNATNNIDWSSYRKFADHPDVAWSIPIALGDSHRGFRVMGTDTTFFEHFKYGQKQSVQFHQGKPFEQLWDVVIGYHIAQKLNYKLGDKIVLAHGMGSSSFSKHENTPFSVSGILKPTGTPLDQTLLISLQGIEAMHVDWQNGVQMPGRQHSHEQLRQMDLTPAAVTAFMLGVKSKFSTFALQRQINDFRQEPLLAILPGVTLTELWNTMSMVERVMQLIAFLVLFAALLGMCTMLLASMKERQQEFAILRSIGAHPGFILLLIEMEILVMVAIGIICALLLLWLSITLSTDTISAQWGLMISSQIIHPHTGKMLLLICGGALALGIVPAFRATALALHGNLAAR